MNLAPGAYTLIVYDANSCSKTYDFIVPENNGECLTIVNTFTPNGDNYNDTWVIRNIHLYPEANVKVFNRWGNLIFESQGEYIPWDGSYKGEQLPSEVYYYVIVLNNDEDNKYTGTVTIVR
jgi:gliding motility-associated-like protein